MGECSRPATAPGLAESAVIPSRASAVVDWSAGRAGWADRLWLGGLHRLGVRGTHGSAAVRRVTSALNNNMLSLKMSPFLTGLEVGFTRHLARDPFGLGPLAGGVMTSGGSLATLHRLAVARNKIIGSTRDGLAGRVARRVVFASEHDHTSIGEAAMLLGLGTGAVVGVPADGHCRTRPAALRREVSASPIGASVPSLSSPPPARPTPPPSIRSGRLPRSPASTSSGSTSTQSTAARSASATATATYSPESNSPTRPVSTRINGGISHERARWRCFTTCRE